MSTTITASRDHAVVDLRPGDQEAATQVEAWLQAYATSRNPRLRERIILAYLGLADRLASRFRDSRGTSPEDLRQTARAGLIAAIDRYDPDRGTPFVPYAVACVVGELKRYLRDTSWRLQVPARSRNKPCGWPGRPRSCTSVWAAPPPPASWPSSWSWPRRRSWRRWRLCPAAGRCRWTSRPAATPTAAWATWSPSLKLGRSPRTCWPARSGSTAAAAGARGHRPAVLPGPGPVRDRGPGRLLPDAHLAPAATRPGPHAHPAHRTLTDARR